MTAAHNRSIFGHGSAAPAITVTRGGRVYRVPLGAKTICLASLAAGCAMAGLVAIGFVSAGGKDFLPQQVRVADPAIAEAYEMRIASLRSEVERLTTRSFMDQAKVASKVDILLDQQAQLANRYEELGPLFDRARSSGLVDRGVPVPEKRPAAVASNGAVAPAGALAYSAASGNAALDRFRLVDHSGQQASKAPGEPPTPELIRQIGQSLDEAELRQIERLETLTAKARRRSEAIRSVFRTEGIDIKKPSAAEPGEGGPFVPVPPEHRFDAGIEGLRSALDLLQSFNESSASFPLARPTTSTAVSSNFGVRSDPFLGMAAMHTGIDFAAEPGSAVTATAAGKVIFAGENGGYGNMVEIEHANGLTTRYAHLSAVLVSVGDKVATGAKVGRVGSTGRSTGPHLHYEVRQSGEPVDPERYLRAGRRISALG